MNSSVSVYLRDISALIAFPEAMASLTRQAAAVTSRSLMMAPPTMMMEAPAARSSGADSEVMPPATATGTDTAAATCRTISTGAAPPFICSSMPTCRHTYAAPSSWTFLALATLSSTPMRSIITPAPY